MELGMDQVANRKSATYRKLGLKDKNLNDEQLFAVLVGEQGMIRRPLIEKDDRFFCGFDEEAIIAFVK